jgi:hypothetical protein
MKHGDRVWIKSLQEPGTVMAVTKNGDIVVETPDGMRVTCDAFELDLLKTVH